MPERPADDPRAYVGRLYDSYGASLYRYASILLGDTGAAEDAIQQVFAGAAPTAGGHRLRRRYLRRGDSNYQRPLASTSPPADCRTYGNLLLPPILLAAASLVSECDGAHRASQADDDADADEHERME
jgi:hypothetical protein